MTFYEIVREEFEKEIKRKTSWGKNEVMMAFDKAFTIAMAKWARMHGIDVT